MILQRAGAYGYATEYLGWVVSRAELLAEASRAGMELDRELLLDAWLSAAGAPEDPIGHRGFLSTLRRTVDPSPPGRGRQWASLQSALVSVYADLLRHRELFGSLFRRDLRAKYKGSLLGLAWTLALPAALMLVYLVVFAVLWKAQPTETDDYWLFLLCGLPPWVFFATSRYRAARAASSRTRRSSARCASRASSSRFPSLRRRSWRSPR